MTPVWARGLLAISTVLAGCGGETAPQPEEDGGPPAAGCPAGSTSAGEECVAAGVAGNACASGFVHDGAGGCEPVLPSDACAAGTMATPGETACRPVAPCSGERWGRFPTDGDVVYVDGSYAGTDSDGSPSKPWTTVQDGVAAAAPGSVIALAEGSFVEDVVIDDKPVKLWGVCPERSEIVGGSAGLAAIVVVGAGAAGTEIHDLAVRGDAAGIAISGAVQVVVDRVWIHETGSRGLVAEDVLGPVEVVVGGVLVEKASDLGVLVAGARAEMSSSVVRDTRPRGDGLFGRGVAVQRSERSRGAMDIHSSVVDRNHDAGVFVGASDVVIEASVVTWTYPREQDGGDGRGLDITSDPETGERADVVLRASAIAYSHVLGVYAAGSDLEIENSTIRDTLPEEATGLGGRGLEVRFGDGSAGTSKLAIHTSKVARSREIGVFVAGSEATIESTLVTDTQPGGGEPGYGIGVAVVERSGFRSSATVRACVIEHASQAGVLVTDSDAVIEATYIRETRNPAKLFGDALSVVALGGDASATVSASLFEGSDRAGVATFGAATRLATTELRCNAIDLDGEPFAGQAFELDDQGGNVCGCADKTWPCQVLSSSLTPPAPIDP